MDSRQVFSSRKKKHQVVIEDHNNCCLCGAKLDFTHKVDYVSLQVQEDADCKSCGIRLKSRDHTLQ